MSIKKLLIIISSTILLSFSSYSEDIDIDGSSLDWDFTEYFTIEDSVGSQDKSLDIKSVFWKKDKNYLYFMIKCVDKPSKNKDLSYYVNIDTDFNEIADINIDINNKQKLKISKVDEFGNIVSELKAKGALSSIGEVVEFRIPKSIIKEMFKVSFGIWDSKNFENLESTMWSFLNYNKNKKDDKKNIDVAIKNFTGNNIKTANSTITVDGSIEDWGGVKYKSLKDNSAYYYKKNNVFYFLTNTSLVDNENNVIYYVLFDINNDSKADISINARYSKKGFIFNYNSNEYSYSTEVPQFSAVTGKYVEFSLPTDIISAPVFRISHGLYDFVNDIYYYYTPWHKIDYQKKNTNNKIEAKKNEKDENKENFAENKGNKGNKGNSSNKGNKENKNSYDESDIENYSTSNNEKTETNFTENEDNITSNSENTDISENNDSFAYNKTENNWKEDEDNSVTENSNNKENGYTAENDTNSNETTGPISGLDALINTIKDSKTLEKFNSYIVKGIERPLVLNGYPPETIADSSLKYQGIPYVSGSYGWNGVDCSGLTKLVMEEFKIDISRSANEQGRYGIIIPSIDELKKGDLLFFINTYPTSNFITHVGLYLGDYKFINANSYYGKVMIDNVSDKYWKPKFLYGTRGQ